MSVLHSPAYWYLLHYKLSILKFLPAPVSQMSARSLHTNSSCCWHLFSPTASSTSTKNYKQSQGAAMGSPVSSFIANIYMEYFESLAIPTSPTLIQCWLKYVDDVHMPPGKMKSTNFKNTSIP